MFFRSDLTIDHDVVRHDRRERGEGERGEADSVLVGRDALAKILYSDEWQITFYKLYNKP